MSKACSSNLLLIWGLLDPNHQGEKNAQSNPPFLLPPPRKGDSSFGPRSRTNMLQLTQLSHVQEMLKGRMLRQIEEDNLLTHFGAANSQVLKLEDTASKLF